MESESPWSEDSFHNGTRMLPAFALCVAMHNSAAEAMVIKIAILCASHTPLTPALQMHRLADL